MYDSRLSHAWHVAIADFLTAQTAAGHPRTTRETRRQHLSHLARRIEREPWQVTGDDLIQYAAAQQWARETRRSRRVTFLAFWEWAIKTDRTGKNPATQLAQIKSAEPQPLPVPDATYIAALLRADNDEALWIDLAAEHGLRRAEIACIHTRDLAPTLVGVDLHVHGKGGKPRTVPLTPPMARALTQLSENSPGYLWPGNDHGHISPRWLGKRVNRLLDPPWTIHKLRHRAATRFWSASDGDPYAVASLMGWSNLNMVHRYVYQPTTRLRSIVHAASRARGDSYALIAAD